MGPKKKFYSKTAVLKLLKTFPELNDRSLREEVSDHLTRLARLHYFYADPHIKDVRAKRLQTLVAIYGLLLTSLGNLYELQRGLVEFSDSKDDLAKSVLKSLRMEIIRTSEKFHARNVLFAVPPKGISPMVSIEIRRTRKKRPRIEIIEQTNKEFIDRQLTEPIKEIVDLLKMHRIAKPFSVLRVFLDRLFGTNWPYSLEERALSVRVSSYEKSLPAYNKFLEGESHAATFEHLLKEYAKLSSKPSRNL